MSDDVEETKVVETTEVPKTEKIEKTKLPKIVNHDDAILELRNENKKLRKTLEEQATVKAEELSNKKLEELRASVEEKATTHAEKILEAKLAAVEETNRARLVKAELKLHAQKAGVVEFEDFYEIVKKNLKTIEFDEDGEVTNAGDFVAEIKGKKPHLFAGVSTASSERAPVHRDTAKLPEKVALKMSNEEYAREKARLLRS